MVILINPFYKERDEGEWNEGIPHIGQAYIASYYRKKGGSVKLIDANYHCWGEDRLLVELEPYMSNCRLIGISVYTLMWPHVKVLIKTIKSLYPGVHITLGGYHPTLFSDEVLLSSEDVDSVIIGEGEVTFYELATCIEQGIHWTEVDGIAYIQNGSVHKNNRRNFVENLDIFPFPERDYLFNEYQTVPLCASRGCYSNCSFCSISSFYTGAGKSKFRMRSAKNIVDEIEMITNQYGNKEYWFIDDNFLSAARYQTDYAVEFAQEILDRGLDISFHLACRADEVNEDILRVLVKSGLKTVMIGIESANERQLKFYNKGYNPQICVDAISILKKCKIQRIHIGFIMFDPYVTVQELSQNLKFFKTINYSRDCRFESPITLFNRLKGYQGTPIYNTMKDTGVLPDENNDYEFFDYKVRKLYEYISVWNKKIYEIYKLMCAWIFRDLMDVGELVKAKKVYSLAYEYMKIDEIFFEEILSIFEKTIGEIDDKKIQTVMNHYNSDLERIRSELTMFKAYSLHIDKGNIEKNIVSRK